MDNLNNWELNPGERDFNWEGAEQQIGDQTTETRLETTISRLSAEDTSQRSGAEYGITGGLCD